MLFVPSIELINEINANRLLPLSLSFFAFGFGVVQHLQEVSAQGKMSYFSPGHKLRKKKANCLLKPKKPSEHSISWQGLKGNTIVAHTNVKHGRRPSFSSIA